LMKETERALNQMSDEAAERLIKRAN
jgi:hypothetical protein